MKRITVEEDDVKLRFTQSTKDDFYWHMEVWHEKTRITAGPDGPDPEGEYTGRWLPLPGTEFDARDLLWQCAATINVGQIANRKADDNDGDQGDTDAQAERTVPD